MNAVEALLDATDFYYFLPDHLWLKEGKVGQAFEQLPEDMKEKLRGLKSDDLKNVRLDAILPTVYHCLWRSNWVRERRAK